MAAVPAAGTALATAVANDDEALEAPGAALYAGGRPITQATEIFDHGLSGADGLP